MSNIVMACNLNYDIAIQDLLYSDDSFYVEKWNIDYEEVKKFCETTQEYNFSIHYLAYMYENGKVGKSDIKNSFELYTKSFERGNKFAANNIAFAYQHGRAVDTDYAKAKEYYEIGLITGCRDCLHNLGHIYKYGVGVEKDLGKAVELFKISIEKRNSYAMNSLADLYMRGEYLEQNYETAIILFEQGAALGNPSSFTFLAKIYKEYTGERDKEYIQNYFLSNGQEEHLKTIYSYSDEFIEILVKNYKLEQEVKTLRAENTEMKNHILASPDGPLYFEALKQWKMDIKQI